LKSLKAVNHHTFFKFHWELFKQEVEEFVLRFRNLLILFRKRKKLFIRSAIKLIIVIVDAHHYYTVLSNILMSRLTQYADKIVEDYQYGF
jgi:tRNA uridine 5-carbamoylmethylation protein Kti12